MTNEALREHVTSVGFALTLSKRQIEMLVLMDHYGDWDAYANARPDYTHSVTTSWSLVRRGLEYHPNERSVRRGPLLTTAGRLVAQLLKEAGIYQDVLARSGNSAEAVA